MSIPLQKNPKNTKTLRQELRASATTAEKLLWQYIKEKQIDNYRFRRQHGVGPYILDFYCPQIKLAIELDGEVHNRQQDYDEQRSYFLNRVEDIEVLRFESRTAFENSEQIIWEIEEKFSSYHLPLWVLLLPGGGEWR